MTAIAKIATTLVFVVLLFLFLIPQGAYAHATQPTGFPPTCPDGHQIVSGGGCDHSDSLSAQPPEAYAVQQGAGEADPNLLEGIFSLILQVVVIILYLTLFLSNFLLWLAGMLFNTVFVETVLQFGQNFGNTPGVLTAWTVLRDLGNIFLLFSFVFMGIATILNLHDYTVKKTLPRLIIFAVLLNFSLFAAEAVVDVSNGISSAIVGQAIPTTECVEGPLDPGRFSDTFTSGDSAAERCTRQFGITGLVMNNSHLSSVLNLPAYQDLDKLGELDTTLKQIATLFGLSIFSSVLSVVFFAAAIMLIIRVIVLTFIIVTAPIGFAGMAVPFMGGIAERWWHELVNQSLFVPIFLLLVFVGLKVVEGSGLNGAGGQTITDAIGNGDIDAFSIIVTFAVTAGFFLAALMVAKRFGAHGADFAIKTAGGLTYGTLGFAGRQTLGRGAANMASALRTSSLGSTEFGRRAAMVLDKGATSSFDFRGGIIAKTGAGIAGVDLGSAGGSRAKGYLGGTDEDTQRKLHYNESIHEEHERKSKELLVQRKETQDQINEGMQNGTPVTSLVNKLDRINAKIDQNHEAKLHVKNEEFEKLQAQHEAQEKILANARARAQQHQDAANATTDPALRAVHEANAQQARDEAAEAEGVLEPLNNHMEQLSRALTDLKLEVKQERLKYSRHLQNGSVGRWLPAADRTNFAVAYEARRKQSLDKKDEQFEKLLGVVKLASAPHPGGAAEKGGADLVGSTIKAKGGATH